MALKTKKPGFSSANETERLSMLIAYIDELTDEIEFRFEAIATALEKLRAAASGNGGSDAN